MAIESKQVLLTEQFKELIKELSYKEAIIITLKLGFVDDKYYETSAIANFLDIDEQEVRDITRRVIEMYKERLNNSIDATLNAIEKDDKTLKIDLNKKI